MKIGFIGLGKMGAGMVARLLDKKIGVVVFDVNEKAVRTAVKNGAYGSKNLADLAKKLPEQKIIWLMVPHSAVDSVVNELVKNLSRGDIIIDGGNSFYKDSVRRAKELQKKRIHFLDAGVSGGLQGARNGASIMVGGEKKIFRKAEPIFKSLAVENGYEYFGRAGAGHFVKMAHNGIEYALLQSYGEGYKLVEASEFKLDSRKVTKVWRNGSVIRSWILDLAQDAFDKDAKLKKVSGIVCGGSTGQWTVDTAKKLKTEVPLIELALKLRYNSRKNPDFASKVVAVLRKEFGGHKIPAKGKSCKEMGL